jgi:sugar-specific transcriptional regulator TrmB
VANTTTTFEAIYLIFKPQNMPQLLLEKLGLSPNEAKIYLSLIKNGEHGASEISIQTGIHRRNVYDSLNRLLDKGLVQKSLDTNETKFAPVDPTKLEELLAEKEKELRKVLPALVKEFEITRPQQQSYIAKGYEGIKALWKLMLKEGKTIYSFGVKGQWGDPKLINIRNEFLKQAKKQKLEIWSIFDFEFAENYLDYIKQYPHVKIKGKIMPEDYDSFSQVNIFGDYVVFYNQVEFMQILPTTTFYIIRDKDLAESHRRWFEFMWSKSKSY